MALYSIEDKTLAAIGDAIRSKTSETRWDTMNETPVVSKTNNATGFETHEGPCDIGVKRDVVHIEGATKIAVRMSYQTHNTSYYIEVLSGDVEDIQSSGVTKYKGTELQYVDLVFENTDTITFFVSCYVSENEQYLGYYAECTGWAEVKNTMNPIEMATAINGMNNATVDPIVLTDSQMYGCAGDISSTYIKLFGDTISTFNITNANNMFQYNKVDRIPFEINIKQSSSYVPMTYMFYNCHNLKEVPKINNAYPESLSNMFSSCYSLRTIPEDFVDNWNFDRIHTYAYASVTSIFSSCFSLRRIPESFIKELWMVGSYYNTPYQSMVNGCHSLDEVTCIPICPITLTTNTFSNTFASVYRLKRCVFTLQEDGTPYTVQWKSQIIDLSNNLGVVPNNNVGFVLNRNSGITADKEVKDDATYQALKDNPDWFTCNVAYSRYNHDSTVETINSLPDTSAYLATAGGTNTIKFQGTAGSATDGGAINTLTEEEIAVATAKGWTVTLV